MQTVRSRQSLGRSRSPSPSGLDVCIKVACRVRPSASSESSVVTVDGDSVLVQNPGYAQEQLDPYTFDHAFDQESSQEEIYRKVAEPVVQGVLSGINGTVFCYGQTGSGKTYTMEGIDKDPGLLPRLGKSIFETSHVALEQVSVCFVEIYMEKLQDLLEPANRVEVRETMSGSIYLANVCERVVSSSSELLSCVKAGQKNRSVASTKMNERSSRSHSVFSVSVKTCDNVSGLPVHGVLHFVDLAGSESQGRTGAVGQTLEQSKHINQSLLGLGRVIAALGTGQPHVPYRDSKLTRILQDSLGGSAKTSLIVNISPEAINSFETVSSLRFGQGASLVKNAPRINLVDLNVNDLRKLLSERDAEIARLRARVAAIEGAPSPEKTAKWITISTPEKIKPGLWEDLDESQGEVGLAEAFKRGRRYWATRCVVAAVIAITACLTNPGKNEEDFRRFLSNRQQFSMVYRMLEALGLVKVGVWDIGLGAIGHESSRCFLGAFDQWIELPGVFGWTEDRDVDALALAFLILFLLWQLWPLFMARHCSASGANLRGGRLWSLFIAQLSHAQLGQLLINILFLYSVGPQAHAVLDRQHFFALLFTGGGCAMVGSLILWRFLRRFRHGVECLGACGPLYALLAYIYAAGHCTGHAHWLGHDWSWPEFAALQLVLGAISGLDVMAGFLGGAVGWAAAEWQLLELVPRAAG